LKTLVAFSISDKMYFTIHAGTMDNLGHKVMKRKQFHFSS